MPEMLPKEFEFRHDFCFFLHDLLVGVIVEGEKARVFNHDIRFRDKEHSRLIQGMEGDELCHWLEHNGYQNEVQDILFKQNAVALLSDFCHFIYEALTCSRKGKLTVTWSLLRRPLKENLLYLEWMLGDTSDFLRRFSSDAADDLSIGKLDPSQKPPKDRIAIIRQAMEKTPLGVWIDPQFLHELRYDKAAEYGLDFLFQKSTHLITTQGCLKTEAANFNMIFSDDAAKSSQWEHLYRMLPIMLFHAFQVVEALVARFASRPPDVVDLTPARIMAGFLMAVEESFRPDEIDDYRNSLIATLDKLALCCPECGSILTFNQENVRLFYEASTLRCSKCQAAVPFEN